MEKQAKISVIKSTAVMLSLLLMTGPASLLWADDASVKSGSSILGSVSQEPSVEAVPASNKPLPMPPAPPVVLNPAIPSDISDRGEEEVRSDSPLSKVDEKMKEAVGIPNTAVASSVNAVSIISSGSSFMYGPLSPPTPETESVKETFAAGNSATSDSDANKAADKKPSSEKEKESEDDSQPQGSSKDEGGQAGEDADKAARKGHQNPAQPGEDNSSEPGTRFGERHLGLSPAYIGPKGEFTFKVFGKLLPGDQITVVVEILGRRTSITVSAFEACSETGHENSVCVIRNVRAVMGMAYEISISGVPSLSNPVIQILKRLVYIRGILGWVMGGGVNPPESMSPPPSSRPPGSHEAGPYKPLSGYSARQHEASYRYSQRHPDTTDSKKKKRRK